MNKLQWRSFYQSQRLYRKSLSLGVYTSTDLVKALREVYNFDYTKQQDSFICLVSKYKKKLPRSSAAKKLNLIRSWRPEARVRAREQLKNLVYSNNPFLSLTLKNDGSSGAYVVVPFKDKK